MTSLLWLIPLLPFVGFVVNGLLGARVLPRRAVGWVACGAVGLSFLVSLGAVASLGHLESVAAAAPGSVGVDLEGHRVTQTLYTWMSLGASPTGADLRVAWAYALDPLSAVMVLVVTGVGFLIHVYSTGYMGEEPRGAYARYFAYLNLFMAMMLTLVLGASLPVVFVGWEGVGLCSYLLIGFYHDRMFDETTKMTCADAGRKAFIVNRIGDIGFMLGMLLLFAAAGTLDIQGVVGQAGSLGVGVCTAAGLLLFLGACGKSAQIPLYVWLPDAMAGPTPVSALIHAATMVTAGVYVVCRMAPIYLMAPVALTVVAVVGGVTALFAATIGLCQNDIKKVLAYSTVSQLGYMMLGAGCGAFTAGVFHLMTHAFFKALLFLGAGSVIHAMSGEQDIRKMGGLRRFLPVTHATFLVAVLAITGIPPFAGFFSKDSILAAVLDSSAFTGAGGAIALWGIGVLTAALTGFYMTRLYLLVFAGASRAGEETRHHLHEAPWVMLLPLVVLALGSAFSGFLGVPELLGGGRIGNLIAEFLAPVLGGAAGPASAAGMAASAPAAVAGWTGPISEWAAMALTLLAAGAGIAGAAWIYGGPAAAAEIALEMAPAAAGPAVERPTAGGFALRLIRRKFYGDEIIEAVVLRPYRALCRLSAAFDDIVVDGLVNAAGEVAGLAGEVLRAAQTGYVRNYALAFLLGSVVIVCWAIWR